MTDLKKKIWSLPFQPLLDFPGSVNPIQTITLGTRSSEILTQALISEIVNNCFGLFATFSFTNSNFRQKMKAFGADTSCKVAKQLIKSAWVKGVMDGAKLQM